MSEAPDRPAEPEDVSPVCSARGCRGSAVWVLAWNNPTLHTPDRRKTWTACDEHLGSLSDFLSTRGFLRETVAIEQYRHDRTA